MELALRQKPKNPPSLALLQLRLALQADNRDFSGQDASINYPVHHLRDFATVTPNS